MKVNRVLVRKMPKQKKQKEAKHEESKEMKEKETKKTEEELPKLPASKQKIMNDLKKFTKAVLDSASPVRMTVTAFGVIVESVKTVHMEYRFSIL